LSGRNFPPNASLSKFLSRLENKEEEEEEEEEEEK
jgi:hypothetical protein